MTVATQVRRIPVNGVELSYVEEGKGDPVVLVHGYFGDYRTWAFQMGPFAKTYRTIAYSLRYNYPYKGSADEAFTGNFYVGPIFYAAALVVAFFSGIASVLLILAVAVFYSVGSRSTRPP